MNDEALLTVTDLVVRYPLPKKTLFGPVPYFTAVKGISFHVNAGEALGLVGESGCGKSTTSRAVVQLLRPAEGKVRYQGEDLTTLSGARLREHRRRIQMIFQDPYASLNPRLTAAAIVAEPIRNFRMAGKAEATKQAIDLLERVGLEAAMGNRYPHEFSGGQRQRIGVARALAAEPELLICDEPVSALDVSIQAQILNLLLDLRKDLGLAMLFIAHDLSVVRHLCDRIAIMKDGLIVEEQATDDLFADPRENYTRNLLSAIPEPDPEKARAMIAERMG